MPQPTYWGDFNLDMSQYNNQNQKKIIDLTTDFQLKQLITAPTRTTATTATIIDLIFGPSDTNTKYAGVIPLGISDHDLIYCSHKVKFPKPPPKIIHTRNWKHFNEQKMTEDVQTFPWSVVETFDNVTDCWDFISKVLTDFLDTHAPYTTKRVRGVNATPWVDQPIKDLMHTRDHHRQKLSYARKHSLPTDELEFHHNNYKSARNKVNIKLRQAKIKYYNTLISESMGKSDKLWPGQLETDFTQIQCYIYP